MSPVHDVSLQKQQKRDRVSAPMPRLLTMIVADLRSHEIVACRAGGGSYWRKLYNRGPVALSLCVLARLSRLFHFSTALLHSTHEGQHDADEAASASSCVQEWCAHLSHINAIPVKR